MSCFANICSSEEPSKVFKSSPYLSTDVERTGKKNIALKWRVDLQIKSVYFNEICIITKVTT